MTYDLNLDKLTDRERDVLLRIIKGCSTTAIAAALKISTKTVESHRTHINRKLRAKSALEIVRRGLLCGVFSLDDIRDL